MQTISMYKLANIRRSIAQILFSILKDKKLHIHEIIKSMIVKGNKNIVSNFIHIFIIGDLVKAIHKKNRHNRSKAVDINNNLEL